MNRVLKLWAHQGRAYLKDIKVSHTLFSLPFLVVSVLLSGAQEVTLRQGGLLLGALLCARSYAMGMNRLIDASLDALNERTEGRMIPSGALSVVWAWGFVLLSALGLGLCALWLRPGLIYGALGLLLVLGIYPWMKRVHVSVHFYLGASIGSLPFAVYLALGEPVDEACVFLGLAMAFWITGFDILYSLQDLAFDRSQGLKSLPARLGVAWSTALSGVCYILALTFWTLLGVWWGASFRYYLALAVLGAVFFWQLRQNKDKLPRRVLQVNAWLGVVYLLFFLWDFMARASL